MNEEVQQRREFTSEEVQEQFDKVDEHFASKSEEKRVTAQKEEAEAICPECRGMDGHHYTNCTRKNEELPPALEQSSTVEEPLPGRIQTPEEQLSHVKIPPSPEMLVGNELLWLVARTCHEVNRAYCVGVLSDHSHQPWEHAPEWQRQSCYEGVLKHYENPEFTPEDSHKSWMAKKIEDGWVFGNLKSIEDRTHPNLVPYHTLHIHERTKDTLFSAICKSFLGGVRK